MNKDLTYSFLLFPKLGPKLKFLLFMLQAKTKGRKPNISCTYPRNDIVQSSNHLTFAKKKTKKKKPYILDVNNVIN